MHSPTYTILMRDDRDDCHCLESVSLADNVGATTFKGNYSLGSSGKGWGGWVKTKLENQQPNHCATRSKKNHTQL